MNNNHTSQILITLFFLLLASCNAFSNDKLNSKNISNLAEVVEGFIANENKYTFFGLSSYYNVTNFYLVNKSSIKKIETNNKAILQENEWLAVVCRLNVLIIKASGVSIDFIDSKVNIKNQITSKNPLIKIVAKSSLLSLAPELDQIRYIHLWKPIAWLAKVVESTLIFIQQNIYPNWGWSVVIFSVLLKIILLPVGVMTVKFQRRVSQIQSKIAPKLAEIKASYDGEEAHNLLMAAHKELGVSPFYTLKPMLGSFIQVPILIAVFNALGEMPQLSGQSFFWIKNLSLPDAIGYFSNSIPMFGNTISLLPIVMTVITLFSTVIFKNRHAPVAEMKRQKCNLYFMAFAFFVLFYPFPAVMVLYWTIANFLQTIQQQLIRI